MSWWRAGRSVDDDDMDTSTPHVHTLVIVYQSCISFPPSTTHPRLGESQKKVISSQEEIANLQMRLDAEKKRVEELLAKEAAITTERDKARMEGGWVDGPSSV